MWGGVEWNRVPIRSIVLVQREIIAWAGMVTMKISGNTFLKAQRVNILGKTEAKRQTGD